MLERLRTALVYSFVGAIVVGSLLAQGINRFVSILIEPASLWITRRQFWAMNNANSVPPGFPFQEALSRLLTSMFLLLIAYGLLRWLYYLPPEKLDGG